MLKRYMVERHSNGVGFMSMEEFCQMAKTSNESINNIGTGRIQWIESYVSDDKIYCVFLAENEEVIKEHARMGCFPVDSIMEIKKTLDPSTATLADAPYIPEYEEIYDSSM